MLVEPVAVQQQPMTGIPHAQNGQNGQNGTTQSLKDIFLQLLAAELSHQDPLSPMNGTEFVAQLTQLNALEQMQEMNTGLRALLNAQRLTQATSLIGYHVQATASDGVEVEGEVSGVQLRGEEIALVIGELTVPLSAVTMINAPVTEGPAEGAKDAAVARNGSVGQEL